MAYHKILPNQTLAELVASVAPHLDPETVKQDPKNKDLFRARDAYILNPGDPVWFPDEEPKYEWHQVASGETLTLEIVDAVRQFKLSLIKPNRDPIADEKFTLQLERGIIVEGTTDSEGVLDVEVPFDATNAMLIIGEQVFKLEIGGLDPIHTIKGLQARLANLGFEPGPVDGISGKKTTGAIEAFQAFKQLDESGVADKQTLTALQKAYGC